MSDAGAGLGETKWTGFSACHSWRCRATSRAAWVKLCGMTDPSATEIRTPAVWSCFSGVEETDASVRYRDVLGVKYAYDATVPNHRALSVGDVVVIRDHVNVYGHGLVGEVLSEPGHKQMELCPSCRRSGPGRRVNKRPVYRCANCKHEFDEPVLEDRALTLFEAWYDQFWAAFTPPLSRRVLDGLYRGRDQQNAIRALEQAQALALLRDHTNLDGLMDLHDIDKPSVPPPSAPAGGHQPTQGRRRLGQQDFKDRMLERFGSLCAVTGAQPLTVLDAAHLYRFADNPEHHLDGGLLLRTDIHRLFDAFLLTIDTANWTVQLHPDLHRYSGLAALEGSGLRLDEQQRPTQSWLDDHRAEALRRWALP